MKTQTNGRTAVGRFDRGNAHGRGRPPVCNQRVRLDALLAVVTPAVWSEIVTTAVSDAVNGDRHAREWLSRYLLPRADAVLTLDTSPIEIIATATRYNYADAVAAIAHRDDDA